MTKYHLEIDGMLFQYPENLDFTDPNAQSFIWEGTYSRAEKFKKMLEKHENSRVAGPRVIVPNSHFST